MRREKQREGEEKGEREAGTEEQPASCERECPPRLEARRRRRAGGGDPWASGRDPWKPSDVTGQRRIAAGFLPPPPVPSVPPAPRGPGAPRPSRLSPLPLGVYPSRSLCAPARRVVTLEGNPRQWEGRGPRTHRPGKDADADLPGGQLQRPKIRAHPGDPWVRLSLPPITLVPHLDPARHP